MRYILRITDNGNLIARCSFQDTRCVITVFDDEYCRTEDLNFSELSSDIFGFNGKYAFVVSEADLRAVKEIKGVAFKGDFAHDENCYFLGDRRLINYLKIVNMLDNGFYLKYSGGVIRYRCDLQAILKAYFNTARRYIAGISSQKRNEEAVFKNFKHYTYRVYNTIKAGYEDLKFDELDKEVGVQNGFITAVQPYDIELMELITKAEVLNGEFAVHDDKYYFIGDSKIINFRGSFEFTDGAFIYKTDGADILYRCTDSDKAKNILVRWHLNAINIEN